MKTHTKESAAGSDFPCRRADRSIAWHRSCVRGIPVDKSGGRRRVLAAGLLVLTLAARATAAGPDWKALGDEAADLLATLIQIDTPNPPGGETAAANAIARRLGHEGHRAQVLESSPGRGNVYARLAGKGGAGPVVLLSHLDVVPADPKSWKTAPFAGTRVDGFVYGRGALDDKGMGVVELMTMIAIKRSGQPLDRDVILLATADEEAGGKAGAGWMVEHHPELVQGAEYLLNEGDAIHQRPNGKTVVQVGVAEKTPCWVRLTAHGDAGHGSTPPPETAVTRLVRALNKLRRYRTPVRVTRPVEAYFAAIAQEEKEPLKSQLAHLAESLEDPEFLAEFTRNPRQNALVRNTLTPTVLTGGPKTNVIPAEASAEIDVRLLPGEKPADFLATLVTVIGDEAVQIEPLLSFPASASEPDSPFLAAVRQVMTSELPGVPVIPSVLPGFTDSHYFRDLGIESYGFAPFVLAEGEEKTVHGIDERISVENLRNGVRRLVTLLRALPSNPS